MDMEEREKAAGYGKHWLNSLSMILIWQMLGLETTLKLTMRKMHSLLAWMMEWLLMLRLRLFDLNIPERKVSNQRSFEQRYGIGYVRK